MARNTEKIPTTNTHQKHKNKAKLCKKGLHKPIQNKKTQQHEKHQNQPKQQTPTFISLPTKTHNNNNTHQQPSPEKIKITKPKINIQDNN